MCVQYKKKKFHQPNQISNFKVYVNTAAYASMYLYQVYALAQLFYNVSTEAEHTRDVQQKSKFCNYVSGTVFTRFNEFNLNVIDQVFLLITL